ncbi:MAG: hypothetical protein HY584_00525 [Candidatus Omnitrophica bacterium]|nr:hypothetical protein [Candidatus Omnitrophota bacterium]
MIPSPAFSRISSSSKKSEETREFLSEIKERYDLRQGALFRHNEGGPACRRGRSVLWRIKQVMG